MNKINELKDRLNKAHKIVFFTGAGISVPSGIPDFRSSNGLYNTNLKAEEILSHTYFINHTDEFYNFYKENMIFSNALPNIAHKFISDLQTTKDVTVITQNIDGLHSLAGSKKVIELHGTIHKNTCMKCHKTYDLDTILNTNKTPYCECGAIIKPNVVLYEEALNENDINNAISAIYNADTLVIIGTSLNVYPAASFIRYYRGNNLILLNKSSTSADSYADLVINDDITNIINNLNNL